MYIYVIGDLVEQTGDEATDKSLKSSISILLKDNFIINIAFTIVCWNVMINKQIGANQKLYKVAFVSECSVSECRCYDYYLFVQLNFKKKGHFLSKEANVFLLMSNPGNCTLSQSGC